MDELFASSSKSVAYIIGTHKDKVSEEEIDKFDQKLQRTIRSTNFFRDDLVQFSSEGRMVLPIDNMKGGGRRSPRDSYLSGERLAEALQEASHPSCMADAESLPAKERQENSQSAELPATC